MKRRVFAELLSLVVVFTLAAYLMLLIAIGCKALAKRRNKVAV